jgi:hypothetical protein
MYPQLLRPTLLLAFGASCLAGCGEPSHLETQKLAVIGGVDTGDARPSVLYVTTEISSFGGAPVLKIASGTLVAPNLLLTALHVVTRNPSNVPFTCDAHGRDPSGGKGSLLGPSVAPGKVAVFAGPKPNTEPLAYGRRIISSDSPTICQNDIAFVVLDRALDLSTMPIRRDEPARVGDALTVIGFGAEVTATETVRSERDVAVTAVGQWLRTFTVGEGPCEGDSGGPAVSRAGELVGVFSSVAVDCHGASAAAKYTDVSYFARLAEQAFAAADAGPPWPEPTPAGQAGAPVMEPEPAAPGDEGAGGNSGCGFPGHSALTGSKRSPSLWGAALFLLAVGRRRPRWALRESCKSLRNSRNFR